MSVLCGGAWVVRDWSHGELLGLWVKIRREWLLGTTLSMLLCHQGMVFAPCSRRWAKETCILCKTYHTIAVFWLSNRKQTKMGGIFTRLLTVSTCWVKTPWVESCSILAWQCELSTKVQPLMKCFSSQGPDACDKLALSSESFFQEMTSRAPSISWDSSSEWLG